ncbi:MAG: TolC family protein, partial [Muribaculaceae bacterium]|nr:TolC family protein [Muribaculaceae bacterium]
APTEAFSSQMRHNFGKYLGFSLSVPIFDALSTRNNVRRARVQQTVAELELESASDELCKTVNQAYYQAVGARERLHSATAAAEATQAAMDAMLEKYTLGRATSTDYDTARSAYIRAESDRLQAKYELQLRARILDFYASVHNY